jgi:hypothetical protein
VTGAQLTDAVGSVRLRPPPEGVVSRAFIGAPSGRLPPGVYRCTLRAGRRVVAVAAIRLL